MNEQIKQLIAINKSANDTITTLENIVADYEIHSDKDKANFGNFCIILKGYRMVSEATEALLYNDNVILTETGEYYQKVEDSSPVEKNDGGKSEDKKAKATTDK